MPLTKKVNGVEVELTPSEQAAIEAEWAANTPAPVIERQRSSASITRAQFLNAAVTAGIIDAATAEEAADGTWPTAFNAFVVGLTPDQRVVAKATWADGVNVRRNNATLALLAASLTLTDAQLDALFGIS